MNNKIISAEEMSEGEGVFIMRKIIIFSILLVLLSSSLVAAANNKVILEKDASRMIGLDFPTYGWAISNDAGQVIGYEGINIALGYSQKKYFETLKANKFNAYWDWGTIAFIVPYIGIGGDYVLTPKEDGTFWTIGGGVGLYGAKLSVSYRF